MKSKRFLLLFGILVTITITGCTPSGFSLDKLPWLQAGQVIFKDDFSDQSTGWERVNSPYELKGYSDGGYLISVKSANVRSWSVVDLPLQDAEIQVTTKKITGADDTNFGLICRFQDKDNFYSFVISSDGYYAIVKLQNGEETLLGSEQFSLSAEILPRDEKNQITATCIDDELSLSVNGSLLRSVNDDTYSTGKVGVLVETRAEGPAAVVFTDFSVIKR